MWFRTKRGNLFKLCVPKTRFMVAAPLKKKRVGNGTMLRRIPGSLPQFAKQTVIFDRSSGFPVHHNLMKALVTETSSAPPLPPGSATPSRTPTAPSDATFPE
jgi:hypothetical protein